VKAPVFTKVHHQVRFGKKEPLMQAQTKHPVSARRPAPAGDNRARLIRLVHVARRDLRLDEETYRSVLRAQGGESSAKMSVAQLLKAVDAMKSMGFKVASKGTASGRPALSQSRRSGGSGAVAGPVVLASDAESRKARAMWLTLHSIGQVRDPSERALLAYARRQTGVERMEWVQDMVPVLEPLKKWLLRSLPQALAPYLREPATAWAAHKDAIWHDNWLQAVRRLAYGLEKRHVQLVDEYTDLWQLAQSAGVSVAGSKK
jgi:phage gp16-like protein